MIKPTSLRPEAPEFQPQQQQSTEDSSSGPNTTVLTPPETPKPCDIASQESAEKTAGPSATDGCGSGSTVSEVSGAEHNHTPCTEPASKATNADANIVTASDSAIANGTSQMVGEGVQNKHNITKSSGDDSTMRHNHPYQAVNSVSNFPYQTQTHPAGMNPYVYSQPGPYMQAAGYPFVYEPNANSFAHVGQPFFATPYAPSGGPVGFNNPHGQAMLPPPSSDPISEGRRIYIGNLKYCVNRQSIKKLLRQYGVNHTVEKIYMPYHEISPEFPESASAHMANTPATTTATGPGETIMNHEGGPQVCDGGRNELFNKGFVFVTYTDPYEAETAMARLSGVMHLGRRLVCRPGLPKGVVFRNGDIGDGPRFYGGGKYRRERMSYGGPYQQRSSYNDPGYGTGANAGADSGVFYNAGHYNYAGGHRDSVDSGYRSGDPRLRKGADGYAYGSVHYHL